MDGRGWDSIGRSSHTAPYITCWEAPRECLALSRKAGCLRKTRKKKSMMQKKRGRQTQLSLKVLQTAGGHTCFYRFLKNVNVLAYNLHMLMYDEGMERTAYSKEGGASAKGMVALCTTAVRVLFSVLLASLFLGRDSRENERIARTLD